MSEDEKPKDEIPYYLRPDAPPYPAEFTDEELEQMEANEAAEAEERAEERAKWEGR